MKSYHIMFSPTGGTKQVGDILASALALPEWQDVDLMLKEKDLQSPTLSEEDICVIAMPSFGGRLPQLAAERLKRIEGNGARAILLCVYGNRAYEDTLLELSDIAESCHFRPIAAIAANAEHSILRQFGSERPDAQDKVDLMRFAQQIKDVLAVHPLDVVLPLPGNRPYRQYSNFPLKPSAGEDCTGCGRCAEECPVDAIPMDDLKSCREELCISCMRCIAVCTQSGRQNNPEMLAGLAQRLAPLCSERKANELFL